MNERVLALVERVVQSSSREQPADAVLRAELKREQNLVPELSRRTVDAVFAYYRWWGWLESDPATATTTMRERVVHALALQTRYETNPESFPAAELIAKVVPPWVEKHLSVTLPWARALQNQPPLWLRTRPEHRQDLASRLGDCRIPPDSALAGALEYTGDRDLFCTAEFHEGAFEVQDLSSQIVGLVSDPKPGECWWDACAGEGGKLLHLSILMENRGLIWGSDRAAWRLQRLKRRAARAQVFNYRLAPWNGGPKLPTKTKFDGILVDAPCSGLGTWHRNPHARWTTTEQDVSELAEVQKQLLCCAAPALKPGGKLVYAVCTLTRAETTEVTEALSQACPDLKPLPLLNPLRPKEPASPQLWLRAEEGGNGMFIAAWRNK